MPLLIVVVHPALVARVVGRVDVDALHLALVLGQQRFEGFEVVAMNNHIAGVGCDAEGIFAVEYTIGHIQMVRNDLFFTNPIECRHISCVNARTTYSEEQAGKYHRTLRKRGTLIGIRGISLTCLPNKSVRSTLSADA